MIRKILRKFSYFLFKIHLYINSRANAPKNFTPYILKYPQTRGSKKVVHVIANFIIGGSTQLMIDIIERTSNEYSHKIVVPKYSKPLPYQPVDIHSFSLDQMEELHDFLKNENPEFVHIHYYVREITKYEGNAFWYYAIFKICEDLKIRVIQNVNVPTHPYPSQAVVHNVFVSDYVRNNFNNSDIDCSVIYPGSNFKHFKNEEHNSSLNKTIGMVYRLDYDKLKPESIEVFINVIKKDPAVKCYIVGGGYYLEYYKKRVREEKQDRNFVFTGFVSYKDLPSYYKKFRIFVAPVYDESFGQVTPFAMSMGLAVAGYDTGALSEILGSEDTLVNTGNIEKLSEIIIDLVNNPQKVKAIGESNQKRANECFSVEQMIKSYEKLYDSLQ